MKSLLLLIVSVIIITIFGCEPKITEPEEPKTETYTGYAVGDSGKVYKSVDNGKTWGQKQSGVFTKLNSVYTFSDTLAIAVGDNGVIIKTTDGGNTWNIRPSGTTVNLTKITLNKQTNQCWISGDEGTLLRSNNYLN